MKSEQLDKLAVALNKAQGELKAAIKDKENPFFHSKYATLGSVWDACRDALLKNGFSVVQHGTDVDGKPVLTTTLLHSSGQWISGDYILNPTKNDPQALGSAWTYSRRYSLAAMVGIVVDDDDDGQAATAPAATSSVPEAVKKTFPAARPAGDYISDAQSKRFFAIWKSAHKTKEQVDEYLREVHQCDGRTITKDIYEDCCKWAAELNPEMASR